MSLQGTLDTFALPDVLRLLASTRKSGHLRVDGSRGAGSLWCDDGRVVAGELDPPMRAGSPVEVVYELLRFSDGDFTFHADETALAAGPPSDIEPLLAEAQDLLAEWRDIEAVVPSLDARVSLVSDLGKRSVTVDAEQWQLVVAVAGGSTAGALGEALGLGELTVARAVKDLVEAGLATVDVDAEVPAPSTPSRKRRTTRPEPFPEPVEEVQEVEAPSDDIADAVDKLAAIAHPVEELAAVNGVPAPPEIARQLAQLGPDAARAVAAAAKAETPEERDAALATIEESPDGEPINRGLLLKFLSSVRS